MFCAWIDARALGVSLGATPLYLSSCNSYGTDCCFQGFVVLPSCTKNVVCGNGPAACGRLLPVPLGAVPVFCFHEFTMFFVKASRALKGHVSSI